MPLTTYANELAVTRLQDGTAVLIFASTNGKEGEIVGRVFVTDGFLAEIAKVLKAALASGGEGGETKQ